MNAARLDSTRFRITALIGLVVLAYAGPLRREFIFDDNVGVTPNPVINGNVPITEAFTRDFWGQTPSAVRTYRPLAVLTSAAEWKVTGGSPGGMYVASILLHLLAVLALYLVWRQLAGEAIAFAAAALMAVLAVPSEAVFSVYGQADVEAMLWVTLGLAAHRRRDLLGEVLAVLCYACALGSKESAVVAPIAWLWIDFALSERPRWKIIPAYAGVGALFFVARTKALGAVAPAVGNVTNPLSDASPLSRGLGAGRVFLTKYLSDFAFPTDWQYDCSFAACRPGQVSDVVAWLGVLAAIVLVALAFVLRRRSPVASAALGSFALFFMPVSNFVIPAPMAFGSRWFYMPGAMLCIALAVAFNALAQQVKLPRLAWVFWAVLIVTNLASVRMRAADWQSEEAFFRAGLRQASDSAFVQGQLSVWLSAHGQAEEAVDHAKAAIAIAPEAARTHEWLAAALDAANQPVEADAEFRTALRMAPEQRTYHSYATFLARRGQLRRALEVTREGLKLPGGPSPQLLQLERMLLEDLGDVPQKRPASVSP